MQEYYNNDADREALHLFDESALVAECNEIVSEAPETFPPIVIVVDDELLHTEATPYCADLECPCHEDRELLMHYLVRPLTEGWITEEEATRMWNGEQVWAGRTYGFFLGAHKVVVEVWEC